MAAGGLLLTGLTWTVMETADRLRHRSAASPSASGPEASAGPSASSSPTAEADDRTPGASRPSPATPKPPLAEPYPAQFLDKENSLDLKKGTTRKDRKGDIRFGCKLAGCELESDTSVMALLFGKPRATLDSCRYALTDADSRRVELAAAASGSEICVKHPSGDIALLVIETKSTALPEVGFIVTDLTVWRAS